MSIYMGDRKVASLIVYGKDEEEKAVEISSNGTTVITPSDSGKTLGKVIATVNVTSLQPGSIGIGRVNAVYSQTMPDVSFRDKLWIKALPSEKIVFKNELPVGSPSYETLSNKLPKMIRDYFLPYAVVGKKIYIFGCGDNARTGVMTYDTETNTAVYKSVSLGGTDRGVNGGRALAVGKKIFLTNPDSKKIISYDTESETVTELQSLSAPAEKGAVARLGNYIYVLFGETPRTGPTVKTLYQYDYVNDVLLYWENEEWRFVNAAYVQIGKYVYIFGGNYRVNNAEVRNENVWRFELEKRRLEMLDVKFPGYLGSDYDGKTFQYPKYAVSGTKIYLFGASPYPEKVYSFDVDQETFAGPLGYFGYPEQTVYSIAAQTGNEVYRFGGGTTASSRTSVGVMKLVCPLPSGHIHVLTGENGIPFGITGGQTEITVNIEKAFIGNPAGKAELCDAYLFDGNDWVNVNTGESYVDSDG